MTSDLTRLTAVDTAAAIASGEVSAVEVTQAHLDRIAKVDDEVRAFLVVDADGALTAAREVDRARANGESLGPLAGVPLAQKDVIVTKGLVTTAGSKILEGWTPPYDATVHAKIRQAGIVTLGKANMDEFAMGSSTENSAYGPSKNPWDLSRVPGGSSGGSSAAVASYQAPLAVGTDTGGSIRQPASVCGLVGHKPTYGLVSRYGLIAFSSSLDQAGPLARTVLDAALLYGTIAGHDPLDSTSIPAPTPHIVAAAREGASGDLRGVRIGVIRELSGGEGYEPDVQARFAEAIELLSKLGASVTEVSCPHFRYALPAYYLIAPSECSSNLARFDGVRYGLRVGDNGEASLEEVMSATRDAGFGPEVKRRVILGTYALSSGYYEAYYGQAQKVRTLITRNFDAVFQNVDAVVSPTSPTVAFPLGERVDDPIAMYAADLCTLPASLAGVPALSVPCGLSTSEGRPALPVGLQIMAPALADDVCFRVAAAFETGYADSHGGRLMSEAPELDSLVASSEEQR